MSNSPHVICNDPPDLINPVTRDQLWFESIPIDGGSPLRFRCQIPARSRGTPLHLHSQSDERFVCVSGSLSMQLGSRHLVLLPGDEVEVPRGMLHRFFNATDSPVVFQSTVTPGHEFCRFLESVYGLAADGFVGPSGMPQSLLQVAVLRELSDLYFPAIPLFIQRPAFGILSRIARWRGVHSSMRRYWKRTPYDVSAHVNGGAA